jgi:hypothetical protein
MSGPFDGAAAWWRDLIALPQRVTEIHTRTERLIAMADQITQTLTEVADGLRGPLTTSIIALIESERTALARVAELEGTEVPQSAAAADVRAAFGEVAGLLTPVAEVPDVEPLPDAPADGEPQP